jgi:nitroreductase
VQKILDFEKTVLKRRMVRNFTTDSVPEEHVNKMLELAMHSPSAGFSQGCAYIVVRDPARRIEVGKIQGEEDYDASGFGKFVSKAPLIIVPCVSQEVYHRRYGEPDKLQENGKEIDWPVPYWYFDVGAATMVILLAAVNFGYAAAFTGTFDPVALRNLLGIPEEFHPVGTISIGKPAMDQKSPSLKRGRKSFDNVVHFEKW